VTECCGRCTEFINHRVIYYPCGSATVPSGDTRLGSAYTSGIDETWPDYTEADRTDTGGLNAVDKCVSFTEDGDWKIEHGTDSRFNQFISFSPIADKTEYRILFMQSSGGGFSDAVSAVLVSEDPLEYEVTFSGVGKCLNVSDLVDGDENDTVISPLSFTNTSAPDKTTWSLQPAILANPGNVFLNPPGSYVEIEGTTIYGGFPVNVFGQINGQPPAPASSVASAFANSGWIPSSIPSRYATNRYSYSRTLGVDRSGVDWTQMVVILDSDCRSAVGNFVANRRTIVDICVSKVVVISTKIISTITALRDVKWTPQRNAGYGSSYTYNDFYTLPTAGAECTIPSIPRGEGQPSYGQELYYVLDDTDPASPTDYTGLSGRIRLTYYFGVNINDTVWCEVVLRDFYSQILDRNSLSGRTSTEDHKVWRYESDSAWIGTDEVVTLRYVGELPGYDPIRYEAQALHSAFPDMHSLIGDTLDVAVSWHGRTSSAAYHKGYTPPDITSHDSTSEILSFEVNCAGCENDPLFPRIRTGHQQDGSINTYLERTSLAQVSRVQLDRNTSWVSDTQYQYSGIYNQKGLYFSPGAWGFTNLHHFNREGEMLSGTTSSPLPAIPGLLCIEYHNVTFYEGVVYPPGDRPRSKRREAALVVRPVTELPEPYVTSLGRYDTVTELWVRNETLITPLGGTSGGATIDSYGSWDIYVPSVSDAHLRNVGIWTADFVFDRSLDLDSGTYGSGEALPRTFTVTNVLSLDPPLTDHFTPVNYALGTSDVFPVWTLDWASSQIRLNVNNTVILLSGGHSTRDPMLSDDRGESGASLSSVSLNGQSGSLVFYVDLDRLDHGQVPISMYVFTVSDSGYRLSAKYQYFTSGPFSSEDNYAPVGMAPVRDMVNRDGTTVDSIILRRTMMSRTYLSEDVDDLTAFPQSVVMYPIETAPQQGTALWQWSDISNSWLRVSDTCEENPDGVPIARTPPSYSGCNEGQIIEKRCSGSYADQIGLHGQTIEVVFEKQGGTWSNITSLCIGRTSTHTTGISLYGGIISDPAPPLDIEGEDGDLVRKLCVFTPDDPPVPTCSWTWNGSAWASASDSCFELYGEGVPCHEPDGSGSSVGETQTGSCHPDDCSERGCDWILTIGFKDFFNLKWYLVESRCYALCDCDEPVDDFTSPQYTRFTNPCTPVGPFG
jgi:hypothetical protein